MNIDIPIYSNQKLTVEFDSHAIEQMAERAIKKIQAEGWEGRNNGTKAFNFLQSFLSEEAWTAILTKNHIRHRHTSYYVGHLEEAPNEDFIISSNNKDVRIGIRNRFLCQLERYKELPYPNDRLSQEIEKVPDYLIASSIDMNPGKFNSSHRCAVRPYSNIEGFLTDVKSRGDVPVSFFGAIPKQKFLTLIMKNSPIRSRENQELFRTISIKEFDYETLKKLIDTADKYGV